MKSLANILSYIFHPVYMPTIGMFTVLSYGLSIQFKPEYKWYVCIVTFVFTCVLPVFVIYTLRMMKMASSIHLPTKEERRLPILISSGLFFMAYFLVKAVHMIDLLDYIMIAGVSTMIVLSIVNFAYKLSIHMAAIGSLTALFTALSAFPNSHLEYFLVASIFASGLVGFARLELKAHSTGEVAVGYITGFLSQYLVLRLLIF